MDRSTQPSEREAFFEISADLLAVADRALRFLDLNPAWNRQLGYEPERLQGRSLLEVITPKDRERAREAMSACVESGAPRALDVKVLRSNQQQRTVHLSATADRQAGRLYLVARDITVRERLQQVAAAHQKLEAIGQLASGVAHEINTPIQFVGDNLAFLADVHGKALPLYERLLKLPPEPPDPSGWEALRHSVGEAELDFLLLEVPRSITSATEGVDRVAELVKSLKEVAHPDSGTMTRVDLNRAVQRTLTLAHNEWKYVAEVVTDLGQLPLVPCHASGINQVLLNLLTNAAHAVGDRMKRQGKGAPRGTITIRTSADAHQVTVTVSDTGLGIPDQIKARVFEPFFTTKEVGQGTGQGLAISRSIVCEKHHGALDFVSVPGEGTTFTVRLPLEPELQDRRGPR